MQDPIDVVVNPNDWSALNGAILNNRTKSQLVVAIADGTITPGNTANPINAVTGLGDRAQNVLIRPLHIGGVKVSGLLRTNAGGITLAHFVGGGFYVAGDKNCAVANWVQDAATQSKAINCDGLEIVGLVKRNMADSNSDCLQLGGGLNNVTVWRHWIAGKNRLTDGHVDTVQVLGVSGYCRFENGFHGGGGTGQNSTLFYSLEQQSGAPMASLECTDMFFDHSNNDCYVKLIGGGEAITFTRVKSRNSIRLRNGSSTAAWDPAFVPTTMTDCEAQSYSYLGNDGKTISSNPTPGVAIVAAPGPDLPSFVAPTWWDHSWDSI